MNLLNNITDAADQLMTVLLADGSKAQIELTYRPGIQRWSMNISHPLLTLNGVNVCLGPNILRQWKNLIPFGLLVVSNNGLDPINLEDFQNGVCSIYTLSAAEVQEVEFEVMSPLPLVNP